MSQIEIYKTAEGNTQIEVQLEDDAVWLPPQQIKDSFTTAADGKKYKTQYYNLDVISVG